MLRRLLRRLGLTLTTRLVDQQLAAPPRRPSDAGISLLAPEPASYQGYLDEISDRHVTGWVHDRQAPGSRLECEAVLVETGEVVATASADQFGPGLAGGGVGDGGHAFWTRFDRTLDQTEQDQLVVRVIGTDFALERAPNLRTRHEPVQYVAMDIVDNCNLRCPFCLYDYAGTRTTHMMGSETIDAALRFLPFTRDGDFWFSCLHEPTLHPELVGFVERVPAQYRNKLFFTSNLARRMPEGYFDWLASAGLHHVNVSIESRDPALYERLRKGARFRIFERNREMLVAALDRAERPTPIRYIAMAYKSNLREIPDLTRHLLNEGRAWQVELRYTFDVPFLPPGFREAEFLDDADWDWLAAELSGLPADRVHLNRPPRATPPAPRDVTDGARPDLSILPERYMFRLSWDGTLRVLGTLASSRDDHAIERELITLNIRDIDDPTAFLNRLRRDFG